ncbi:hypothetical protein LX32DRAFT_656859 [Colletotrichum zoysiae]|uniref:Uncharacterized protein n=1 Tax=Colletotrichum zoysiae TaxID=1216348 RepID=A0AAD9H8N6_9PEZI|nr:hypothetical protein LX32DRAFT_656859 [Colletotrichum zoysiae]
MARTGVRHRLSACLCVPAVRDGEALAPVPSTPAKPEPPHTSGRLRHLAKTCVHSSGRLSTTDPQRPPAPAAHYRPPDDAVTVNLPLAILCRITDIRRTRERAKGLWEAYRRQGLDVMFTYIATGSFTNATRLDWKTRDPMPLKMRFDAARLWTPSRINPSGRSFPYG